MFRDKTFYHQTTKKAIVAFGMIFNNIIINRTNSSGVTTQSIRVPLAYSPKQRFLARIEQIPSVESRGEVAITLPRMGFEITGFQYDPDRKISPIQKNRNLPSSGSTQYKTSFVSTPYDLTIQLYAFAKNQEDALQISEQIMPYFNPDFNVTVNDLPEMGIKRDIKIVLDGISYEDQYEGDYDTRRSIVWTFNFTMKLNYYGFVADQDYIRKSIASVFNSQDLSTTKGEYTKQTHEIANTKATATATISGDAVNAIALTYVGDNYTYAPNVTFTGGGGSGASATAVMDGKKLKRIDIDSGGSGYTSAPTVVIEGPEGHVESPGPNDPFRFIEEFEQTFE